jgi:hypothetical protein
MARAVEGIGALARKAGKRLINRADRRGVLPAVGKNVAKTVAPVKLPPARFRLGTEPSSETAR